MNTDKATKLKRIEGEIRKINILSAPAPVFLGLGFYGLFKTTTDVILAALNNPHMVYALLIVGGCIETWQLARLLPLFKQRIQLLRDEDS